MVRLPVAAYERMLEFKFIRWLLVIGVLVWVRVRTIALRTPLSYPDTTQLFRVWRALANVAPSTVPSRLESECRRRVQGLDQPGARKLFLESFLTWNQTRSTREVFRSFAVDDQVRMRLPRADGDPQRQGDLIILKPPAKGGEKGVLMVMYSPSITAFAALFDLSSLAHQYRFVLEPSTWGYQDADFLLFSNLPTDVVVLAQYAPDFLHIQSIGRSLIPIRLGAGDWADPTRFSVNPSVKKEFDAVMVASWLRLKRHYVLFDAMKKAGCAIRKVALVGMPSDGREMRDVQAEAKKFGVLSKLDWYEKLPHSQVSELLQRSHASLMLSSREGASRIIYESMFCDVPVILSDCNVGVNRDHINSQTGLVVKDKDLGNAICMARDHSSSFRPRAWALENTGYQNATRQLQHSLRARAIELGEPWTSDLLPKVSAPNLRYVNKSDWETANPWFCELKPHLRS